MFFEGTTISVGRGTKFPFQVAGHPKLKGYDFNFTPQPNEGSMYPKHENKSCNGLDLREVPFPDKLNFSYLFEIYQACIDSEIVFFNDNNFFEKLAGTKSLRNALINGTSIEDLRASWANDLTAYKNKRKNYILYEE